MFPRTVRSTDPGSLPLTEEALPTVIRLEAVACSTAQTWFALQTEHDLYQARKRVNVKALKKLIAA